MNILLSSVGRRGYLVKYFKQALGDHGQVWGADNSPHSPGFVYCDGHFLLPLVDNNCFVDMLLSECLKNKIDVVVPLIDPELEILAEHIHLFNKNGIEVLISPKKTVEMTFDKYQTVQFAKDNGIAVPHAYIIIKEALVDLEKGEIDWPLVVKPRRGSASANITYCYDQLQLEGAFESCPEPMIQEVLEGDEYGYDLFGDKAFKPISVYCKKKLAMRAGETDKAISTDDPVLIEFGLKILKAMRLVGPADLDVIVSKDGPKLLEINPRFGGGYPCSHLAGADFTHKVVDMISNKPLIADIGSCPAGVCMLKQDEIIQPDWDEIV